MENHPEIIQPNQNIQPNLPPPEEDVVAQNQPGVEPEDMFNNSDEDSQDTMDILNRFLDFDDEPELQPENQIVPYQPPPQPPFNQQNQPGVEPEYMFNDSTEIFHLPPHNLRDFTLSGGVLYERVLAPTDVTRVSLPVTDDPSTTLPMSPIGLIHRVWDPYQHHWWDFTTGKLGSVSVLKGWQAYQRAHKLLAGDRIQFRSATNNLTHEVFYVLVQFRASPGSTSFELPYQNVS